MPANPSSVTDVYAASLLPLLPPGDFVCSDCGTAIPFACGPCFPCSFNRQLPDRASTMTSLALSVKGSRYAWDLAAYKSSPDARSRDVATDLLTALTSRWLATHERCLAAAARADGLFDVVTVVPSRRARAERRLADIAEGAAPHRYRDLLIPNDDLRNSPTHTPDPDLFRATSVPEGTSVLIIEDTWATGASAQSAACALKSVGARGVAILALGRHFRPMLERELPGQPSYLERAQQRGWSWDTCRLCTQGTVARAA